MFRRPLAECTPWMLERRFELEEREAVAMAERLEATRREMERRR